MRRLVSLLPFALLIALVVLFVSRLSDPAPHQEIRSVLLGKPAPAVQLTPLRNKPALRTEDLHGPRPILVNFFASWCLPCRVEQPQLMRLSRTLQIPIYGIAWKDSPSNVAAFLQRYGNPYQRVGIDESGRTGINWGITGVPESFIITPQGRIAYRHWGDIRADDVDKKLMPYWHKSGDLVP